MRRFLSLVLVTLFTLSGCGADPALAVSLANAARPSRLPYVVACWEKEFAVSPPEGGYVATVDFVVRAGTSKLEAAELRSLEPVTAEGQPSELQKVYDAKLELELGERLASDLGQPAIPEANRKRLRDALEEARAQAKKTGARIGCKP